MNTHYHMTIAGCERDLPICPLNDKLSIGAFVIFGDCELTQACATELLKKAPEFDYLITAESKGIPLAYEMARQIGAKKWMLAQQGRQALYEGCYRRRGSLCYHDHCSEALYRRRRCRHDARQAYPHRG